MLEHKRKFFLDAKVIVTVITTVILGTLSACTSSKPPVTPVVSGDGNDSNQTADVSSAKAPTRNLDSAQSIWKARATWLLAQDLELRGLTQQAQPLWDTILIYDPYSRFVHTHLLQNALTKGDTLRMNQLIQGLNNLPGEPLISELLLMGQVYTMLDKKDSAALVLEKAAEKDDQNPRILLALVSIYEKELEYEKLVKVNRRLLPMLDYPPELVARQLLLEGMTGDTNQSMDLLRRMWQKDHNQKWGMRWLNALRDASQYEALEKGAREVLTHHQQDSEAMLLLAYALGKQDKLEEAYELYLALWKKEPGQTLYLRRLAAIEMDLNKQAEAEKHLEMLVKLDSVDWQGWYLYSIVLASQHKGEASLNAASRLIQGDSTNMIYRQHRARIASVFHQWDVAHQDLDFVIQRDPNGRAVFEKAELWHNQAVSMEDSKTGTDAQKKELRTQSLTLLEKVLQKDAHNAEALRLKAMILERLGKFAEAKKIFEQLVREHPQDHVLLNYLAYSLAVRRADLPWALDLVNKALTLKPEYYAYIDTKAWVLFQMGKTQEAYDILVPLAQKDIKGHEIWEHLGEIADKLGKSEEALIYLKKAVESNMQFQQQLKNAQ